jgi:PIN domain nuclease of toxin-antitoxin system
MRLLLDTHVFIWALIRQGEPGTHLQVTRIFSVTRCLLSLFSAYFALTAVIELIQHR